MGRYQRLSEPVRQIYIGSSHVEALIAPTDREGFDSVPAYILSQGECQCIVTYKRS
jgi:hypothetical protein